MLPVSRILPVKAHPAFPSRFPFMARYYFLLFAALQRSWYLDWLMTTSPKRLHDDRHIVQYIAVPDSRLTIN